MFGNGFAPVVRSWWLGLVLAVVAGVLPAAASAAPAERPRIGDRPLEPAAGWHGRAIVKVHQHPDAVRASATRPSGWSAGPVALGAGLSAPKGSRRVREIQRRLRRLGYDPGPVDGRFGRRTQAAVGWFQHKHGMPVTGVATAAVVRHVRARGQEETEGTRSGAEEPARRPPTTASMPTRELPAAAARASGDDGTSWWWAAVAAAAALVLLALGLWRFAPRGRDEAPTVYELWAEGHSPDPAIGGFRGVVKAVSVPDDPRPRGWTGDSQYLVEDPTKAGPVWVPATAVEDLGAARQEPSTADTGRVRAIGYLNVPSGDEAGDPAETSAAGGAIDEACRERDWELIQIVRDSASTTGHRSERPGLSFALERVAAGEASCLVVQRLGHLARSVTELGGLLDWFTEHDATLVICDIELDTSTTTGRRSAQTLAAVSAWEQARSDEHDHAQ
jgi:peptidoglycan hydrolase-like protein with peptidoglycan-binding domain